MPETDFDAVYRRDPDPFDVGTSWYERRKQGLLLASLTQERYESAWDCAAGTGHLADALARRCGSVVATDASPRAVELATERTASRDQVTCAVGRLPGVPQIARGADLVVVAEVLYYLPDEDRTTLLDRLVGWAAEIALVHWRHHPHDAWLSGADVHAETAARLDSGHEHVVQHLDRDFVLDSWVPR